jgi:hypothetical protein
MKKARLLVPVSVIAIVLLLMAPVGALAAPSHHEGGSYGGDGGWNEDQNGGWDDHQDAGWDGDWNGGWDGGHDGGWDGGHDGGWDGGHDDGWDGGHDDGWDGGHDDGFTYIVKCGDTLGNIAARFGVNSTYLAQVNGLWNPNWIYAGQALWIPGDGCW